MPRPAKPYMKIKRKDTWAKEGDEIIIPRPPPHSTHVHLQIGNRKAVVPIKDFDVLWGSAGKFHFLRMQNNGKITQTHKKKWSWDGETVKGMEALLDE